MSDKEQFDAIWEEIKTLPGGVGNPRAQELWAQAEKIKNRNGGFVPEAEPTLTKEKSP